MNKEMPLNVEWMPQSAYMHKSLDHLLPADQNQPSNVIFIKQEEEFFELNSHPVQNTAYLRASFKENNKEVKEHIDPLNVPPYRTIQLDPSSQPPKKPTSVFQKLSNRGHIDVIEMSVEPVSNYRYLFIYEDQLSNFVVLKALRSNIAKEVAIKLFDILAIIGAPQVLQSGNGRKFAEQVVHELRSLWNDFFILHGDVAEYKTSTRDFKDLLESWIRRNPTKTWCDGLNFIQIIHNSTFRCQNGKIPCQILFGRNVHDNFESSDRKKYIETLLAEEEWIKHSLNKQSKDTVTTGNTQSTSYSDNHVENMQNIQNQNESLKEKSVNGLNSVNVKTGTNQNSVRTIDVICEDEREINNESKTNEYSQSLKCKYCQKQYMKLGYLKNHMKTHETKQLLKCILCSKTFNIPRLYAKHMKQSHKQHNVFSKENCIVRNTRSNSGVVTNTYNKEKSEIHVSHEIFGSSPLDENCDVSLDIQDFCNNKNTENVDVINKRKSSTENRISKIQCTLQCTFCNQKFNFPSVLERHMRCHTNERPYMCEICNKSFKQMGHLSQHSLTHHDYRSFQCMICTVKFDSLDSLKQHTHSHKGMESTLKIKDIYRLFECDSCKKVFTTKSVLERHIFTHTQERQYDCKVCGKRFKQTGHVKSHMLIHTGERKFQCTICSKRFSLSNSLKKHMYVHNGEKPYQCDVCGARFLEKRNLNGHLLAHTNERPYCCKICGKRYTLADTLRRHIRDSHEDGRTYQCEICAKMFKQLAHLSVHKKVHNDERPFQCHLCEKSFKHKNVLKSHLAIHANVRPFECDDCKATFVRKTNLQTHITSAHMNERPYVCKICGKRFKQISHLNGHVVVHSNLMPYKCDFCDRRCNRLDNMKKHMRLHTKNKE